MKIVQINKTNSNFTLPGNARIVYIGMEHLESKPINTVEDIDNMDSIIPNFKINESDILEFNNIIATPGFLNNKTIGDYDIITIGYENN